MVKKAIVLGAVLSMSLFEVDAQDVSGIIMNADGEKLPFVSVQQKGTGNGTISDATGKFSIKMTRMPDTLVFSFIGFERQEIAVTKPASSLSVFLQEETVGLDEVVVTSNHQRGKVDEVQIGVEKIEMAEMQRIPSLFGERDIVKSIQLLPGVKSEGDGSSGFEVRGGTASQNLILLDNAKIYNAGHLMGVFSAFNDECLADAQLYKGQIPAQYGGATSSVFDVNTKVGNMQDYMGSVTIGLLSSKATFEGPIAKNRASMIFTARRSYIDLFLKPIEKYKNDKLNFYDLNAKVNVMLNDNNLISLSLYRGRDIMELEDMMGMHWGNTAGTLKWFHQFGARMKSHSTFVISNFDNDMEISVATMNEKASGNVAHKTFKQVFEFDASQGFSMNFGFETDYVDLTSGEWNLYGLTYKEQREAWQNGVWLNAIAKVSPSVEFSAGLRLSTFGVIGGNKPFYNIDESGAITNVFTKGNWDFLDTYVNLEPRFSLKYMVGENQSLKLGYSRTTQNIQAVKTSGASLPVDRYTMTSNIIKPQIADQFSLGYSAISRSQDYELSAEGYFKYVDNVYDYRDGKSAFSEIEIERILLGGEGRSYGMEVLAKKSKGNFTGWVSYTLSWSENKILGINNGDWYNANNDRRHDISVVGMYKLSDKWDLSASWVYNTGQSLTAPCAKYELNDDTHYYYAERNGYRAPDYHRLDISATNTKKLRHCTRIVAFGIYNAYCHYNPYMIYFENDDEKPSGSKCTQVSLFGIIPSVSLTYKF